MTPPPESSPLIIERWRAVATDFHGIRWCISQGSLPANFEPADPIDAFVRWIDGSTHRPCHYF